MKSKTSHRSNQCKFGGLGSYPVNYQLLCYHFQSSRRKYHQEATPIPRKRSYRHSICWLCRLRGASIRPTFSWRCYKILMAIRGVLTIIHVYHFSAKIIQFRGGMPTPPFSLRLWHEINWWKWPPMDPLKRFQHNCRYQRTPIFEWISQTHMGYLNPNGGGIYHR